MRARHRVVVVGAAATILAVWLVPVVWQLVWRSYHPAPLGRTAETVDAALGAALPGGTARDSVLSFLDRLRVPRTVDSVGERRIVAMVSDIDADIVLTTGVQVQFDFDSTWRVRARRTMPVYTGP